MDVADDVVEGGIEATVDHLGELGGGDEERVDRALNGAAVVLGGVALFDGASGEPELGCLLHRAIEDAANGDGLFRFDAHRAESATSAMHREITIEEPPEGEGVEAVAHRRIDDAERRDPPDRAPTDPGERFAGERAAAAGHRRARIAEDRARVGGEREAVTGTDVEGERTTERLEDAARDDRKGNDAGERARCGIDGESPGGGRHFGEWHRRRGGHRGSLSLRPDLAGPKGQRAVLTVAAVVALPAMAGAKDAGATGATGASVTTRQGSAAKGPLARWFVFRALAGLAPKLALVDAAIGMLVALAVASTWRAAGGPRAAFEQVVPMLGTGLRWSVALPLAWGALSAIDRDEKEGLIALARRRGVSLRRWIVGRALGAGVLVAFVIGVPMMVVAFVLAGFGGGLEGSMARLSLIFPSFVVAVANGLIFGLGGVVLGAIVTSRGLVVAVLLGAAALGSLVDLALPGPVGVTAHQLISPILALEDLQALLFAEPHADVPLRGASALAAVLLFSALGVYGAAYALKSRLPAEDALST